MTLPTAIIAGAPKCGTSSLFAWLVAHPDVCGSKLKETRYFLDRDHPLLDPRSNFHDHGLAGYEAHFEACADGGAKVVLEATPQYIYSETALEVLPGLEPLPELVFLLRRPSERAYSAYQFARNNQALLDREVTFRDFVGMVERRDPAVAGRRKLDEVLDYGRYADYLGRWLARVPRAKVHVFLFEDLTRDNRAFMKAAAAALGLDPGFYDAYDFPLKNLTYQVKLQSLHRLRSKVGRRLPREGRTKTLLRKATKGAYALNVVRTRPAKSDDDYAVLAELDSEYAADNDRLAREAGLDLSAWR
jgi:hypothetical protein